MSSAMIICVFTFVSVFLVLCKANVIPTRDPENVPNLFNLPGMLANNRTDIELFEGDIAMPVQNGRISYNHHPRWPHGLIPYEIDGAFDWHQRNIIIGAMNTISHNTNDCIRFVERSDHPAWLRIISGGGCWSQMGNVVHWGGQDLSLQIPGCVHHSVALHELIHAIGFAHEQTRPDRDSYVEVFYGNIDPGQTHNFDRFAPWDVNTFGEPYDFSSIMHYRNDAFSINGWATMKPIVPGLEWWEHHMGRGDRMSDIDIRKVKAHYECQ